MYCPSLCEEIKSRSAVIIIIMRMRVLCIVYCQVDIYYVNVVLVVDRRYFTFKSMPIMN